MNQRNCIIRDTCSTSSGHIGNRSSIGILPSDTTDNVCHDIISTSKSAFATVSSPSVLRTSRNPSFRTQSNTEVLHNSLDSPPLCSNNDQTNGIQKVDNFPSNYKWEADVFLVRTREELLQKVKFCVTKGLSLRVKASGWSCNRFLDPSKSDDNQQDIGVQIVLAGEFDGVLKVDDPVGTITAGAATQRQPIYAELDKSRRQLTCSGECFTTNASQEVGGLIANAVHDTMQESFSPETVHSIEALVFDEHRNPVIRSFSSADGDEYFAFFGGMGMTGIIVSATLLCVDKKYYHYRPYLPGTTYDNDVSFRIGKKACNVKQLIQGHGITEQGADATNKLLTVNVPKAGGLATYQSSFSNALQDLCNKHKSGKDDVCAMFYLFPSPEEEEKAERLGTLADGSVPIEVLPRYWKRSSEDKPMYTVTQDQFNDISPLMGKEYLQDPRTIDVLLPSLLEIQNSVASMKWKYANLMNHTSKESTPEEVSTAISPECRHWAFCESGVAHTTGPNYIYLWERATEFYIKEEDINEFVQILQPAIVAMIKTAIEGGIPRNAARIYADCRYVLASKYAFMSGWYGKDHLAIDIGCTKHHFTNDQYTEMTTRVLRGCKEKNIDIRLHTGKFYVYDDQFTHHMYSQEIRGRFGAVVRKFDPHGVFAPQRWRNLFTDNCTAISSSRNIKEEKAKILLEMIWGMIQDDQSSSSPSLS